MEVQYNDLPRVYIALSTGIGVEALRITALNVIANSAIK